MIFFDAMFYLFVLVAFCTPAVHSIMPPISSKQNSKLLLFVHIRSTPDHEQLRSAIRDTWLIPCRETNACDYRFFIDINEAEAPKTLLDEALTHCDIVFRDFEGDASHPSTQPGY